MQNNIKEHDLILLKHEIFENDLIKKGLTQDEAHKTASKKYNYNYEFEARRYYDNIKERKKRK